MSIRSKLASLEAMAANLDLGRCCRLCRPDRQGQAVLLSRGADGQVRRVRTDERGELRRANASGPGWARDAKGIWTCPRCGGQPRYVSIDGGDRGGVEFTSNPHLTQTDGAGKRRAVHLAVDFERFLYGSDEEQQPQPVEARA